MTGEPKRLHTYGVKYKFIQDASLMPFSSSRRVVIVGSGLGGLLTGAFLATRGYSVTVCESLAIAGGRFTHINYEGFAVPTGAFHAFPGGEYGPISQCLRKIGIDVDLVIPVPSFQVNFEGLNHLVDLREGLRGHSGLRKKIGMRSKLAIAVEAAITLGRSFMGMDRSVANLVNNMSSGTTAPRLFDHYTKFSIGVPAEQASVVDIARSLIVQKFGREGFLRYGNHSLISSLENKIVDSGGAIRLSTPIASINTENGKIIGAITCSGEVLTADIIILNIGLKKTFELLGALIPNKWRNTFFEIKSASGAAHSIRSTSRIQTHSSIEIPLDLDYIAGIVPLSEISPSLCPSGSHYSLAYQYIDENKDTNEQIELAHNELKQYFGNSIDIFNTAIYRNGHPAANMAQCIGQHGNQRLPMRIPTVRNLFCVGHDVCGYGIAAEIIGYSCQRLWRHF